MRTLNSDLLTSQVNGYPTGGYSPAVRCILTSKDGGTTHDYSFDPTVTTNRLEHVQQIEERGNDSGLILLSNNNKSVPSNLNGYYVDLGFGLNTVSGLQEDSAVTPRLWVMSQSDISGASKGSQPNLYTLLQLEGVWGAVLNKQPILSLSLPTRDIDLHRHEGEDDGDWIISLMNKTIYGVLEQLIENELSAQTGLTFTLDDLGTQDDGQISTVIPFPTKLADAPRLINADSPSYFQTYGDLIRSLLELTKCVLVPRAGLNFRIMYPQSTDAVDKTYYSSVADGHPFYEAENRRLNMIPNHIVVYGGIDVDGRPEYIGHWFDTDNYSGWVSPAETATYDGAFMPVTESGSTNNELWETGFKSDAQCVVKAAELGWKLKDSILGMRVTLPMDASIELNDRVETEDQRGH